ncbi:MAG: cytochrome b N-terminal domain-containing protein [Deltaproteobacteria bacterium]|jgi:ubiquinol-cytochrome c reductase cytochrome b subunit|nr:cytochrome b N-terminal domain-containing protein [Deltaproteobacteria bacterium]
MSRLINFITDRIGWQKYLKPFLAKPLPAGTGWLATLGSLCALLFAVQAVTGIILAFYYSPSPEQAYTSINFIMNDVTMGAILRGIHHWGAGAMVIFVFIHLAINFFNGAFKAPREFTWIVGVVLFLLTLGFGFTGYLLPWDQKAYWATVVSTNIPKDIPLVGQFVARLMLGGDTVSGLTLTRFYAIHTLLLPALTAVFIFFHIYLVRVHDISGHGGEELSEDEKTDRFFPEHLFRCSIVFGAIFGIVILLSIFAEVPLENVAGTVDPAYLPRPEWYYMWLFQLLTFFPGKFEIVGSLVIPIAGIILLFCLPFLSNTNLRGMADRPLATAAGITCLVAIIYLTLMGFEGARPYGKIIVVPDRQLTQSEQQGLNVYVERECAYCHHIAGRGGRSQGPDLSNAVARGRTKDWLAKFIKDPQAFSPWSIMPKYDLKEKDLNNLSDFILALDFDRHGMKILSQKDIDAKNSSKQGD